MSNHVGVRITVVSPAVAEEATVRTGTCRFIVTSSAELPRASAGTVRVAGRETTPSGAHACRMLKHYKVEREQAQPGDPFRAAYTVTIDLSDESVRAGIPYLAPGCGVRRPDEPVEEICRRIAGIFGRYCEAYRSPSISIELDE